MTDGEASDASSTVENPLPATGVIRTQRRGGWKGDDMEMEHRMDHLRRSKSSSVGGDRLESGDASPGGGGDVSYTAVDLSQFRNTEVGKGYQARGVVRQKGTYGGGDVKIRDMTVNGVGRGQGFPQVGDEPRIFDKNKFNSKKRRSDDVEREAGITRRERYLRCRGLREFRKELDKILSP
mmetsp:Transcript_26455/g.78265  ORF Transcript_26455/g.78265 Transcript_26455/m.78265 type:complete len:180 (-) Transcript_26455:143-682(-)